MKVIVGGDGLIKIWRKKNEAYLPECIGHIQQYRGQRFSVMVWGCVTFYGVGTLTFINGNMNSEKYIETLGDNLWQVVMKHFPNRPYLFQDDYAPCHASRATKAFKERNSIPCLPWPAQSPDLNIIENIWLVMKNHVQKQLKLSGMPTTSKPFCFTPGDL